MGVIAAAAVAVVVVVVVMMMMIGRVKVRKWVTVGMEVRRRRLVLNVPRGGRGDGKRC